MEPEDALQPRQTALYQAFELVAETFGMFDQGSGANGAHYMSEDDNPFVDKGLMCANCVFYEGGQACEIVEGTIEPFGLCKFWVINESLVETETQKAAYTPPEAVRNAAKQALRWIADRKSTRLNSSHMSESRMPSSA